MSLLNPPKGDLAERVEAPFEGMWAVLQNLSGK